MDSEQIKICVPPVKTFWLFFYIMLQRKKERKNRYLRKISHCIKMRTETPSPANWDLSVSQSPGQLHFDPSCGFMSPIKQIFHSTIMSSDVWETDGTCLSVMWAHKIKHLKQHIWLKRIKPLTHQETLEREKAAETGNAGLLKGVEKGWTLQSKEWRVHHCPVPKKMNIITVLM